MVGATARLAVECDGDRWHGPDAYQRDMARQRELERCGWQFARITESDFIRDAAVAMAPVWQRLSELEIYPSGWTPPDENDDIPAASRNDPTARPGETSIERLEARAEPYAPKPRLRAVNSAYSAARTGPVAGKEVATDDSELECGDTSYSGSTPVLEVLEKRTAQPSAPRQVFDLVQPDVAAPPDRLLPYVAFHDAVEPVDAATSAEIIDGLVRIVAVEGPIVGHRLHSVYVRSSAGQRVGHQIARTLNKAVTSALRRGLLVADDPLGEPGVKPRTFRLPAQPAVSMREIGPREFLHVPPAELAAVMKIIAGDVGWDHELLFRETAGRYGVRRLGSTVRARLESVERLSLSISSPSA